MEPVRGIIGHPYLPDGVPRLVAAAAVDQTPGVLAVEIIRDNDGRPALRDLASGAVLSIEDLSPFAALRVTEPPGDDEGRELLAAIIQEGLPIADSSLSGNA